MKQHQFKSSKRIVWTRALVGMFCLSLFVSLFDSANISAKEKKTTVIGEQDVSLQWTPEIMKIIMSGDVERGKALAKKHKCKKCHGKTGISDENDTPNIGGLSRTYAFKQMYDYKHRRRHDKSMRSRCEKISYQDIADLSAWFETHKMEPMLGVAASKTVPVLVEKGDKSRQLLACKACHNDNGKGRGLLVPAIGGQKREHFVDMMTAYKEGERRNDDYGVMRFIAEKLSEEEIERLALYYGSEPLEEDD